MTQVTRRELFPGVWLRTVHTDKFKSSYLSLTMLVPLDRERAAANALLFPVLRRGTREHPDMESLLPERRRTQIYQAEPYVLAADVYAAPGHLGRGGWSWYTGAAGWYYRTAVEELLGLKVREGRLFVEPHLPEDWPGWTGEWELDRGRLSIQVSRGRELSVRLDGREIRDGVPLRELTGDHRLEVTAAPGNGKLCFSAKDVV